MSLVQIRPAAFYASYGCINMKNWEGLSLGRNAIAKILENYPVGSLTTLERLERPEAEAPINYIITTQKGRYFLKQYRLKEVSDDHFRLLKFLETRRYPCVRLISTKDGSLNTSYRGRTFALFNYVDGKQIYDLDYKSAYLLGKYLGRLHRITSGFKASPALADRKYLTLLFKRVTRIKIPRKAKPIIAFISAGLPKTAVPKGTPVGTCHSEFTSDHALYKNGKIIAVIDWDGAGRDYMIHDLGSCLYSAFRYDKGKFVPDFNALSGILAGYESERRLTKWEREHIYEALMFGVFKNAIWSLSQEKIDWKCGELKIVDAIAQLNRETFYNSIHMRDEVRDLGYDVVYVPHRIITDHIACYNVRYKGRKIAPEVAIKLKIPLNQIWISEEYKKYEGGILYHELQEIKYQHKGYDINTAHKMAKEDEKKFDSLLSLNNRKGLRRPHRK